MESPNNAQFVDYYELLGVKPTASIDEIRRAYLLLAKQHHPDAGGSAEKMKSLNVAYRTLAGANTKAAYDMLHNFHIGSVGTSDYRYSDGREVHDVSDMKDSEVDSFLDNLLAEYRNGPPKQKYTIKQKIRKFFDG